MRTLKEKKNVTLKDQQSSLESHNLDEETGSYEAILAKRSSNDTSLEQLRAETEDSREDSGSHDPNDKRERR
jgi:hypothetical protein